MKIKNTELVKKLRTVLDAGEADAIALALETDSDLLVIDEAAGRKIAKQYGLRIIGVLGILLNAKQRGLIPSVKSYMDELVNSVGFHVSENLYNKVLKIAKEL